MAAPTLRTPNGSSTLAGSSSATVSPNAPTGAVANDILVALIYIEHGAAATYTLPQNALINNGGGITNSQTTVPYDTGTNLRTSGEITIDNEVITYTGGGGSASGTLTGCTRGAYGTTAATHADNAIISNWVKLRDSLQAGPSSFDYRHITFWKRVGSSEPTSYTWTFSSAAYREAFIITYQGCITTGSPLDVENATIAATQGAGPIAPSITTTVIDTLLLGIYTTANGGSAVWAPGSSGMTERIDFVSMSCYDVAQAAAAATGTKTVSETGTGTHPDWNVGALIALKPPPFVTTPISVGGSITPAGALVKQAQKRPGGSITPAATLARQVSKVLSGGITPAGTLIRQAAKTFAGAVTPASVLGVLKAALRTFTGTITPTSTIVRHTQKPIAGSLTPAGSATKTAAKGFAGSIASSGAVTTIKAVLRMFGGPLTPTGALTKSTSKGLGGTVAPSGGLTKRISKAFAGVLASAGSLIAALVGTTTAPSDIDLEGSHVPYMELEGSHVPDIDLEGDTP